MYERTLHRGAILMLALMFMLMMAIIATTVMQTTILQLHMAGNNQFFEEAFQQAQAIVTELSVNLDNFALVGGVGYTNCPAEGESEDCDLMQLAKPVSAVVPEGVTLDYRVIRQDPLLWRGFPIRESQETASSNANFDAAIFEIDVRIDGADKRLGSARLVQGIALRVAALH
jgi:hypothetical protein